MPEKNAYNTTIASGWIAAHGLNAMALVRLGRVSVSSAYTIVKAQPLYDLDVLYRCYVNLKAAGYEVTFKEFTGIE